MAATNLPVTEIPEAGQAGSDLVKTTTVTTAMEFKNDGNMFILARCDSGAGSNQTFTVEAIAALDSGRVADVDVILAPDECTILGPFSPADWGWKVGVSTASTAIDITVFRPGLA